MKSRRKNRRFFLRGFRFHKVDGRPSSDPLHAAADLLNEIAGGAVKTEPGRAGTGGTITIDLGALSARLQQIEGALRGTGPGPSDAVVVNNPGADMTHVDPQSMQDLAHHFSHGQAQSPSQDGTSTWIQPPTGQNGKEVLSSAIRDLLPHATLSQDSLKFLANLSSSQTLFKGEQFLSGATLTFSNQELSALLLSHVVVTGSPETTRALSLAQTCLPLLATAPEMAAKLPKLLAAFFQSASLAGSEKIMKAFAGLFGGTGMMGFEEVQQLVKKVLETAAKSLPAEAGAGEGSQKLQSLVQNLGLFSLPQMAGVMEAQGGFLQGLGQAIGSALRGLAGLMMTNPQNQWPQALTGNALMTELAALMAAQKARVEREKTRKEKKEAPRSPSQHGRTYETEEEDSTEEKISD